MQLIATADRVAMPANRSCARGLEPVSAPLTNRGVIGPSYREGMLPPACEAVLQTGTIETHYLRAGAGAPLLLLFQTALTDTLAAALFAQLSTRYRVVAPRVPAGVGGAGMPLSRWLRELVDGLGFVQPTAIADETLAG